AELSNLLPRRTYRRADDVSSQFELESQQQRDREMNPDFFLSKEWTRRHLRTRREQSDHCLDRAHTDYHDSDNFESECNVSSVTSKDFFHLRLLNETLLESRSESHAGGRATHRNPRWHVDVSTACAIRAAGR